MSEESSHPTTTESVGDSVIKLQSQEESQSTGRLPDYYVAVKPEYIIPKQPKPEVEIKPVEPPVIAPVDINAENTATGASVSVEADKFKEQKRCKKRHLETRPDKSDRICLAVSKGLTCSYGDSCQYSHDKLDFLSKKPADIGPSCYQYETFGFCSNGIMCRYGESHINRETGDSLVRPDELGGVKEKVTINVLSKELQVKLRKKTYDYSIKKPDVDERAKVIIRPTTLSDDDAAPSKDFSNSTPYDNFVKLVDFSNKIYIAPLTTVGNLPYRRVLRGFGADITCGEMAMTENLQTGQASEWALLRRHSSETTFGVQVACAHADQMDRVSKLINNEISSDFVDLNCGCPIDVVCNRGCGSALMNKHNKLYDMVKTMVKNLDRSVTVKMRTGWDDKSPTAQKIIQQLQKISNDKIAAVFVHGRTRQQRYTKTANWDHVLDVAKAQNPEFKRIPVIGNGDIMSWEDWESHQSLIRGRTDDPDEVKLCSCAMIGRGVLVKPWLPQELKEKRHIDISASERLDMMKNFVNYGLEHWGSDTQGVNTTRRFLLESMSFLHRYVPVGILEHTQKMTQRPPHYFGRNDLETLLASPNSQDWVKISEMLLGPVPEGFVFIPKHKSNSYSESNG